MSALQMQKLQRMPGSEDNAITYILFPHYFVLPPFFIF
ncbi:hypothetical protein OROGR_009384 [Orobanche gracilis]